MVVPLHRTHEKYAADGQLLAKGHLELPDHRLRHHEDQYVHENIGDGVSKVRSAVPAVLALAKSGSPNLGSWNALKSVGEEPSDAPESLEGKVGP